MECVELAWGWHAEAISKRYAPIVLDFGLAVAYRAHNQVEEAPKVRTPNIRIPFVRETCLGNSSTINSGLGASERKTSGSLDQVLFRWSGRDAFTAHDLLQSVEVRGQTGSGKTSGSGMLLARQILQSPRFGGLILASKPEDRSDWHGIFATAGRLDDLINFEPHQRMRLNVSGFERRDGEDAKEITKFLISGDVVLYFDEFSRCNPNTLTCLLEAIACTRESSPWITCADENLKPTDAEHEDSSGFWTQQQERSIYNALELLKLATGGVSAPDIQRFIATAAYSADLLSANERTAIERYDFDLVTQFWLNELPGNGY